MYLQYKTKTTAIKDTKYYIARVRVYARAHIMFVDLLSSHIIIHCGPYLEVTIQLYKVLYCRAIIDLYFV